MKQALGASLSAETAAFQDRFAKAEARFDKNGDAAANAIGESAEVQTVAPAEASTEIAPVARVVREAFTIPEAEHAQIEAVRTKMLAQAVAVSKSEVMRAGLLLLGESDDQSLKDLFERLERVKTGRPKATS